VGAGLRVTGLLLGIERMAQHCARNGASHPEANLRTLNRMSAKGREPDYPHLRVGGRLCADCGPSPRLTN
jgi:hypothetical protein